MRKYETKYFWHLIHWPGRKEMCNVCRLLAWNNDKVLLSLYHVSEVVGESQIYLRKK